MDEEKKVKVKVENLYKVFGKNSDRAMKMLEQGEGNDVILDKTGCAVGVADANFEVYDGETLVVMGLSGSGKSTLLRCINRLYEPTTGKVTIDDIDVTGLSKEELRQLRQKKFGMVFQRFALFPHRTVLQNAAFGLDIQAVSQEEQEEMAQHALEQVGLKGWENAYPNQLSGGMQQRVGLARALAINPDILLMDEAFSALDPLIRTEMQDELMAMEDQIKKTIIFITHDLDEALRLGDRIVLMKAGRIVQVGTNEDILLNPATRYVERFVENVDMTKVLSAKDVMVKPSHLTSKDGPRTALHTMKERGISSVFITNKDMTLRGLVMADDAHKAVEENAKDLESYIIKYEQLIVEPDTPVVEILPMLVDNRYPIVVLDENKKMVGMIVRGSVIAGLAERGGDNG